MTAFILKVEPKGFAHGWVVVKKESEPSLSDWENEEGGVVYPAGETGKGRGLGSGETRN